MERNRKRPRSVAGLAMQAQPPAGQERARRAARLALHALRGMAYGAIVCVHCAVLDAGEVRLWTDVTGKLQVEAELMDFDNGNVWLKIPNGRRFHVPLGQLSQPDQQFVVSLWAQRRVMSQQEADADPDRIRYGPPRELCKLANRAIHASSGIAASRRRPAAFWTHNDKGHDPALYLFDQQGRDLGVWLLAGTMAFDWEDLASFCWDGKPYLLVGDTGNNGLNAAVHMLHLVEEPQLDAGQTATVREIPVVRTIHFSFGDDFRDCEALAVDPTDRTVVLVSKDRGLGGHVYALAWPEPFDPKRAYIAKLIATLKLPPATGMDISPDARRAIVVSYESAFEFKRRGGEDWAAAFAQPPREIPLPRREQGESICYGPDGKTLYLTSEQLPTPLWEVPPAK